MTPREWDSMSWHQRAAYLKRLTAYEKHVRELARRYDLPESDPDAAEAAWQREQARQLLAEITPEPHHITHARINEWIRP